MTKEHDFTRYRWIIREEWEVDSLDLETREIASIVQHAAYYPTVSEGLEIEGYSLDREQFMEAVRNAAEQEKPDWRHHIALAAWLDVYDREGKPAKAQFNYGWSGLTRQDRAPGDGMLKRMYLTGENWTILTPENAESFRMETEGPHNWARAATYSVYSDFQDPGPDGIRPTATIRTTRDEFMERLAAIASAGPGNTSKIPSVYVYTKLRDGEPDRLECTLQPR